MKAIHVLMLCAVVGACNRPDDQKTESIGSEEIENARSAMTAPARAQLDSGNAAYKAKDYDRARAHYQRVTDIDQDEPAGWFGIYMTEQARGNAAAADSALARAQKQAPGASLIHPRDEETRN